MASENISTAFPLRGSEAKVYDRFEDMTLIPDNLLRGVYAFGFEKPSEIQKRGIMPIAEGRDLLAQAQSGTGKTGTFTIGSLSRIDPAISEVQVLVLVPTHELADQIQRVAEGLGSYLKIKSHAAMGGHPVREDIAAIRAGCQFLVGTPGRIYDLCHRGILRRDNIRVLILDEADQMLEDRFQDQIMELLKLGFPDTTRVCLFSATWPPEIVKFTDGILQDPVRILIEQKQVPLEGIKQYYVPLEQDEWKFEVLCDIYAQLHINQAMIFCNKQSRADWLAMKMRDSNFTLECLHGGMSSEERKQKMKDFRNGASRVLITTDLTARGIDVQQVETVINFELPLDKANYIHRIGRAARFGRKGLTINICGPSEMKMKQEIEEYWHTNWEALPQDLSKIHQ
jgi:superfamily II DNA/RNA helicase